jgi:hypothetical protein
MKQHYPPRGDTTATMAMQAQSPAGAALVNGDTARAEDELRQALN